jgi:regulator of replication initiation timing/biotin operon repressor
MFNFFKKKVEKEEFEIFKQGVQTGFNSVKQDISDVSKWIKHLNSKDDALKEEISELYEELATIKEELENIKNMISIVGNKEVFKQRQTVFNKQTGVDGVLNSVQTGVQTVFLDKLSTTERAIIFVLLNSDMKLSYEDLAAMLGKRKATIRGQINSIKQKSEGLIEEIISENNKKRVFIPEKIRGILLKTQKIRKVK